MSSAGSPPAGDGAGQDQDEDNGKGKALTPEQREKRRIADRKYKNKKKSEEREMKSQNDALKGRNAELQGRNVQLEGRVAVLEGRVAELNALLGSGSVAARSRQAAADSATQARFIPISFVRSFAPGQTLVPSGPGVAAAAAAASSVSHGPGSAHDGLAGNDDDESRAKRRELSSADEAPAENYGAAAVLSTSRASLQDREGSSGPATPDRRTEWDTSLVDWSPGRISSTRTPGYSLTSNAWDSNNSGPVPSTLGNTVEGEYDSPPSTVLGQDGSNFSTDVGVFLGEDFSSGSGFVAISPEQYLDLGPQDGTKTQSHA